jgi:hypothetical protein
MWFLLTAPTCATKEREMTPVTHLARDEARVVPMSIQSHKVLQINLLGDAAQVVKTPSLGAFCPQWIKDDSSRRGAYRRVAVCSGRPPFCQWRGILPRAPAAADYPCPL